MIIAPYPYSTQHNSVVLNFLITSEGMTPFLICILRRTFPHFPNQTSVDICIQRLITSLNSVLLMDCFYIT